MIYGDTSFLFALYNPGDRFHSLATRLAGRLRQPIALTLLGELELVNGLHRGLAARVIDRPECDAIFRQISDDEAEGILVRQAVDQIELYAHARDLSKKFTPAISARSLDILHVAAARLLRASPFISFDARQRSLVRKAGMSLLPRTLDGKRT
ncbi:MAG: PIN domain-containing protein [Methylacidiphilales bacterium]|nr:PIN domain-containing protein [Candidatus Methylacidiphilales bacterium]